MSRNIIAIIAITIITCAAIYQTPQSGQDIAKVAVGGLIGFLTHTAITPKKKEDVQ